MIYLDMDGVIVDFVAGVKARYPTYDASSWDNVNPEWWQYFDYDFWNQLPWTKDGLEILETVETFANYNSQDIVIATSPCRTHGCMDGKMDWIRRELPRYKGKVLLCNVSKGVLASADNILVDDADKNIKAFVRVGGRGVLVPRPWNQYSKIQNPVGATATQLSSPITEWVFKDG